MVYKGLFGSKDLNINTMTGMGPQVRAHLAPK